MVGTKVDYLIERVVLVLICLWGNWAIYYWTMVLLGDASYSDMKTWLPVLVAQIAVSLVALSGVNLGISNVQDSRCEPGRWFTPVRPDKRFVLMALGTMGAAVAIVYTVSVYKLSKSSLYYDLLWAALLPFFLAYLRYFRLPNVAGVALRNRPATRAHTLDILVMLILAGVLLWNLYGTGFPSDDDAFYAHVISSTLANPDLPVQGQDLLLNTGAPYLLHPTYRLVGYEVVIALLSDVSGIDPLHLYYNIFPLLNLSFWILAAYLFMRNFGVPYPGVAVVVSVLAVAFWDGFFAPTTPFRFLHWGKNVLLLLVAPLLFLFVSIFARERSVRRWLLLFLAVATTGILSSTALFLVPVCVGLACLVFLAPRKADLRTLLLILCTLWPFALFLLYTVVMLHQAPPNTSGYNAGYIAVQGQAFGNIFVQAILLLTVLALPIAARTTGNPVFQANAYRFALVGGLTVLTPWLTEIIAQTVGIKLLSWRLHYAYPTLLLAGMIAGIAAAQLWPDRDSPARPLSRSVTIAASLVFFALFFALMDKSFVLGDWRKFVSVFHQDFEEARTARALIPDGAFVAAGEQEDFLAIFPNPPAFIDSKHYLSFQRNFLTPDEFNTRTQLFWVLRNLLPIPGKNQEQTLKWVVAAAEQLGVTTLVYQVVGGRQRIYFYAVDLVPATIKINAQRKAFVRALTEYLPQAGYDCTNTPSGKTWVCNIAR